MGRRSAISELLQHNLELFKVDLSVSVDVHFGDDIVPDLLFLADVVAQDGSNLLRLDRAATVFVEQLEGSEHVGLAQELDLVDSRRAPLAKVDLSTSVDICLIEDFVGALIDCGLVKFGVQGSVGLEELFPLNQAVAILVKLVERVSQLLLLLFGCEVAGHEGEGRLLELGLGLFSVT